MDSNLLYSDLKQKVERGAISKYGKISKTVRSRIDHELSAVKSLNLELVFILAYEVKKFVDENKIARYPTLSGTARVLHSAVLSWPQRSGPD